MPCYLFTYHAYGSWLPDRRQGYVKRRQGVLPQDKHMARLYAESMKEAIVEFNEQLQRWAIAALLESERCSDSNSTSLRQTTRTFTRFLVGETIACQWI